MISWISNMARVTTRQAVGLATFIAFAGLIGCGGSSETTQGSGTDTTAVHPDTTNMMMHDTTAVATTAPAETTAVMPAPVPTKEEMLQQQMEEIKTENIQLQQKYEAAE